MTGTGWQKALAAELDAWGRAGLTARFWWRDDDAVAPTPALDRLLALAERHQVPVALAVIPQGLDPALDPSRLGPASVILHGFAHRNHAGAGEKKSEFPARRAVAEVESELKAGFARLQGQFGPGFVPALAPPWNRLSENFVPCLAPVGLRGLSQYRRGSKPRPTQAGPAQAGVVRVDCHADPIDWRGEQGRAGGFLGADTTIAALVEHLQAKRQGLADTTEPTGLLTHHLRHDHDLEMFLDAVFAATKAHGAAVWCSAHEAFGLTP